MSNKVIAKYTKHISNMRLEPHMIFICPECAEELQTQQEWRKHLNDKHDYKNKTMEDFNFKEIDASYHECQTCFKLVANANQTIVLLQYHYFLHLPFNRTYRCRHCLVTFRRKRALVVHLCREHGNQVGVLTNSETPKEINFVSGTQNNSDFYIRFICPQCGMYFAKQDVWKEHLKVSHVSTYTELRMHKITVTNNHYCLDCKKLFHTSDREKLQRHHFTHLPHKLYMQCAYCQFKRSYKSEILRHFIYVHTKEFLATKPFIRKPEEFGAKINARLDYELGVLLAKEDDNDERWEKRPQSDLIKRALMNTFIENDAKTKQNKSINHSLSSLDEERIIAESLRNFETFVSEESLENNSSYVPENCEYDSDELNLLCDEIFEVVYDEPNEVVEKKVTLFKSNNEIIIEETNKKNEFCTKFQTNGSPPHKRIKFKDSISNITPEGNSKLDIKSLVEKFTLYLCPQCGIEFDHQQLWRQHVFEAHDLSNIVETKFKPQNDKSSFLCLQCMEVQHKTKDSELQRHYFNHMPYHSYLKCMLCNKTKSSKPKFMQHLKEQHSEYFQKQHNLPSDDAMSCFKCKNCCQKFNTSASYENHQAKCTILIAPLVKTSNMSENLSLLARSKSVALRLNKLYEKYNCNC